MKTGSRRHGFPAVLGRDNRLGGRRLRATIGDATAAHPSTAQPGIPRRERAASTGHGVATATGLALP
jgi:hypothetical protein